MFNEEIPIISSLNCRKLYCLQLRFELCFNTNRELPNCIYQVNRGLKNFYFFFFVINLKFQYKIGQIQILLYDLKKKSVSRGVRIISPRGIKIVENSLSHRELTAINFINRVNRFTLRTVTRLMFPIVASKLFICLTSYF